MCLPGLIEDVTKLIFNYVDNDTMVFFKIVSKELSVYGYKYTKYYTISMHIPILVKKGYLTLLKMYRKQTIVNIPNIMELSILSGQLEVTKWLQVFLSCQLNTILRSRITGQRIFSRIAENGNLKMIKWLRSQNPPCPWNEYACSLAAKGGHLKVLKWLKGQSPPCPWNAWTTAMAAQQKHFDILNWLKSQESAGLFNKYVYKYAKDSDVITWLEDNGCPHE